jgi:hypothetical protein
MNHTEMLAALAQTLPYRKIYLELGVQAGVTFDRIAPLFERSVGIDVDAPPEIKREFYQCSTDQFFGHLPEGLADVDLIFIDADHSAEQVFRDALNALQIIRPLAGLVVLHDTYPASVEELAPEFCGDAWKAVSQLRQRAWVESVTLPGLHGLTICRRLIFGKHLHWWKDDPHESV